MECFNLKEYTGSNKSITGKKVCQIDVIRFFSMCIFTHVL